MIHAGAVSVRAELYETPTAEEIRKLLPLEARAHRWGEEIYFDIDLQVEPEPDARREVEAGDLGYWPAGPAFCVFFGPTPLSTDHHPRAYSPVNVFGRLVDEVGALGRVGDGDPVRVEIRTAAEP
jgi:hypothetical protein